MIGRSGERRGQPALSDDGVDDAKRDAEAIEHGPLLDVKLQITKRLSVAAGLEDGRRVEAVVADRIRDRSAACIDTTEEVIVEGANQCPAADERHAESHSLFL